MEMYIFSPLIFALRGPRPPHNRGFTITLSHTIIGRTPLDEWSVRHRDLYPTTHNTHNDRHPCLRRNSNQQSQQFNGRSPPPKIARLPGSADLFNTTANWYCLLVIYVSFLIASYVWFDAESSKFCWSHTWQWATIYGLQNVNLYHSGAR